MNELEGKLTLLHEGSIEVNDFMDYLLTAQVFMPVRDVSAEVGGEQSDNDAQPLLIEVDTEEGPQMVMVIFTDPDKSKEFLNHFEEYTGGLLVNMGWVIGRTSDKLGICINPNLELGLDLDPATIQELANLQRKMGQA